MKKSDFIFILTSFLVWRTGLFLILFLAVRFVPLQQHFLGGGMTNYLSAPWFWAWANFDGEHYLAIAQNGYGFAEQAFFPLFPIILGFLGKLFGGTLTAYNFAGILVSNISFLAAILGLYRLIRLDFSEKVSKLVIILLLLFPTSFYFGAVYTESLFLALIIWSFYFARKQRWFMASFLGMFASATRVIGILLLPVLAIKKRSFWLLLIPFGLIVYMIFLKQNTGDPLKFLHSLPSFGEQRSAVPILLPQVFYRYVFKIFPNLNFSYFPVVFTTFLEFSVAIFFIVLSGFSFLKLRLDYSLFLLFGYLIPTLSGSFSSLPRYVLVLFPAFILTAVWLTKISRPLRIFIYGLLFISLIISTALFVRGYWVS
jgi:Gpi18-like mannosyltransferase